MTRVWIHPKYMVWRVTRTSNFLVFLWVAICYLRNKNRSLWRLVFLSIIFFGAFKWKYSTIYIHSALKRPSDLITTCCQSMYKMTITKTAQVKNWIRNVAPIRLKILIWLPDRSNGSLDFLLVLNCYLLSEKRCLWRLDFFKLQHSLPTKSIMIEIFLSTDVRNNGQIYQRWTPETAIKRIPYPANKSLSVNVFVFQIKPLFSSNENILNGISFSILFIYQCVIEADAHLFMVILNSPIWCGRWKRCWFGKFSFYSHHFGRARRIILILEEIDLVG